MNITSHNTENTALLNGLNMSSVIVCPNCRSVLAPCVSVSCPLAKHVPTANPCTSCKGHQGMSSSCVAGGIVPYFPLPYVCRHWLQITRPPSPCSSSYCPHTHLCSGDVPTCPPVSPFSCSNMHQANVSNIISNRVSQLFSDIGTAFHTQNETSGGALLTTTKDFPSRFSGSRGGSPESRLIFPNMVLSVDLPTLTQEHIKWTKTDDIIMMSLAKETLESCGWYYGAMTWQEAAGLLANTAVGTFLIRDSSSQRCPFALSVQTSQGPTSIRIEYDQGKFWLDCEKKGVTPQLRGVVELVEYYRTLALAKDAQDGNEKSVYSSGGKHVWIDHKGRIFSPIKVVIPLKRNPSSLQHLCRLAVNSFSSVESQLYSLPLTLRTYLNKYPHTL